MADNYLEKHYEQYLVRKAAWEKARKLGLIRKKTNASSQPSQERKKDDLSEK
ncbi:MAG: hypothetical protein H6544_05335 [Prevotellaceae bacterium]|nr:hypothetical protein [Prevotellaceae bacterium]